MLKFNNFVVDPKRVKNDDMLEELRNVDAGINSNRLEGLEATHEEIMETVENVLNEVPVDVAVQKIIDRFKEN